MATINISTSSPAPRTAHVVLPSIHEMFPEHLIPRSALSRNHFPRTPSLPPAPAYSFDVLKSDPHGVSLEHIASSRPRPGARTHSVPTLRPQSSSEDSVIDVDAMEDSEEGEWGPEESKKHVCPTCSKRFNRPSSLRIHVNTHTGATPFRCPHPSCGRAFNVNSNMRRHFRNHASPAFNNNSHSNSPEANTPPSPSSSHSSVSFNAHAHPPPVVTAFSYPSSKYTSPSPSSPPSASWSASSPSSSSFAPSPVTPSSASSGNGFGTRTRPGAGRPPDRWTLAPVSKWGSEKQYSYSPHGGYSESDVRGARRPPPSP